MHAQVYVLCTICVRVRACACACVRLVCDVFLVMRGWVCMFYVLYVCVCVRACVRVVCDVFFSCA